MDMRPTDYWEPDAIITRATGQDAATRRKKVDEAVERVKAMYGVSKSDSAPLRYEYESLLQQLAEKDAEIAQLRREAEEREELRLEGLEQEDA